MKFIKVMWHCLMKTWANVKGEDHRVVVEISYGFGNNYKKAYCTCGYGADKLRRPTAKEFFTRLK